MEPLELAPTPRATRLAALAAFLLLVGVSWRYGYHRDELYFLQAGAHHLAWGYVDQPPLAPALAGLGNLIGGASPTAIRIVPALAMAATVVLTSLTARELGGGRTAQTIAAVSAATVPVWLGGAHLLSTTPFDVLAWATLLYLFVRIIRRDEQRLWLLAGTVAGVGLLNKWNVLFLVASIAAGVLINGQGRTLANRWVAGGAAIAALIWLPNLIWQMDHDWPSIEMLGNLHDENVDDGVRASFIPAQLLYVGPPLLPIWTAGLVRLLRNPAARPYRAIGIAYVLVFVWFLISAGKPYYLSGLYVALIAAGSVAVESWLERGGGHGIQSLRNVITIVLVGAIPGALIGLPILPASTLSSTNLVAINYDLGEQIAWPAMVGQIADVYEAIPEPERAQTTLLTSNYGEAGAIDRYGPDAGLPRSYSGHNGFSMWGPPPLERSDAVLAVGLPSGYLERFFDSCVLRGRLDNGMDVDTDEQGAPLTVCTGQKQPWGLLWPRLRHYG